MRHLTKITAAIAVMTLILTLLAGCTSLFESSEYLSYENFANQFAKGKSFDKESVIAQLGKPEYYPGEDYLDASCERWHYEVFDYTGYPWGLDIGFDENGNVISAQFAAGKGG